MSSLKNPALNPKIPVSNGCYNPSDLKALPWTYGEIGLSNDEFAYLIRGAMHKGKEDNNFNKHWWSYQRQAEDMKLGTAKISFINQLLENSGIVSIVRRPGRSNVYEYRMIKADEVEIFREIIAEEREKLEAIYDSDGGFIATKKAKSKPIIRTGEKYQIDKAASKKKGKKAS